MTALATGKACHYPVFMAGADAYFFTALIAVVPLAFIWRLFQFAKKKSSPLKFFLDETNNPINGKIAKLMPVMWLCFPLLYLLNPGGFPHLFGEALSVLLAFPACGISAIAYYGHCLRQLDKLDTTCALEELSTQEPKFYFNHSLYIWIVLGGFLLLTILIFSGYFEWVDKFNNPSKFSK